MLRKTSDFREVSRPELLKIPLLIGYIGYYSCYQGIVLPGLLGILVSHTRETYYPTRVMRWDRDGYGILPGSPEFALDLHETT